MSELLAGVHCREACVHICPMASLLGGHLPIAKVFGLIFRILSGKEAMGAGCARQLRSDYNPIAIIVLYDQGHIVLYAAP